MQIVCVSPIRASNRQSQAAAEGKSWSKADFGTPEFFEWLNTIPPDAAERLGEPAMYLYQYSRNQCAMVKLLLTLVSIFLFCSTIRTSPEACDTTSVTKFRRAAVVRKLSDRPQPLETDFFNWLQRMVPCSL